jgi:hypothetical protein
MIYLDRLWIFAGSAPVRLSTVITFLSVFVFVTWRFRSKGWMDALYNGVVSALFTFFLYEVLFNVTGGFPPTESLYCNDGHVPGTPPGGYPLETDTW